MTREQLAMKLDGREYGKEITKEEAKEAKKHGLVVVYGYSDDNVELEGAIKDEIGAYDGTKIKLTRKGILKNECDNDDCPHFEKILEAGNFVTLEAVWGEEDGPAWTYKFPLPHSKFEIMEDGDVFCEGIVFDLNSLPNAI